MFAYLFRGSARSRSTRHIRQRRSPTRRGRAALATGVEILERRHLLAVTILDQFDGLSFRDTQGFVPPDTCGAAGPSSFVETVNQTIRIMDRNGGAAISTVTFDEFFFTQGRLPRVPGADTVLSDPVVVWNEQIRRFIVGDQHVNFTTHVSRFDLAVSKTATPGSLTGSDWYFVSLSTTEAGYDADYPGNLGFNRDALVFTLNMFAVDNPSGHVQVNSVKMSDLAAGRLTAFRNNFEGFNLRPAVVHDSAADDAMWLIAEGGNNASVDVVKMTNVLSNAAGLSTFNLRVDPYLKAINPLQPDGSVVGRLDSRMQRAAVAGGQFVAAHTVSTASNNSVVRWYQIDVRGGVPRVVDQGNVASAATGAGFANVYSYIPAIDINAAGSIGICYMQSSTLSNGFMSMFVTGRTAADPRGTMQTPVLARTGAGLYRASQRVGDLGGMGIDPDGTFWAVNEFANTDAGANWGTAVAHFSVGGAVTPALPNDKFGNAIVINSPTATLSGTNVGATKEPGEPNHAGNAGGRSVWYSFTAAMTGPVTIDTINSGFDTTLAVYTGDSVATLTPVGSDDDGGGNRTSRLTFSAVAGTTYRIAVDGFNGATGLLTLNLAAALAAPINDAFATPTPLAGTNASVTGTNASATKQAGEPNHAGNAGGHSVWYSWTAPVSAQVTVDLAGSTFDTLLAVYTGSSLNSLRSVAANDDFAGRTTSKATFHSVAGTTYRIAVDGKNGDSGMIAISIAAAMTAISNDNFVNSQPLSGAAGTVTGRTTGATKEPGEPDHAGDAGGQSIWYSWTAPLSATYRFDTVGSGFDTLLAVYTGDAVASLTRVASDDDSGGNAASRLSFSAVAGATYRIAVDGFGGAAGSVRLNYQMAKPANDSFANAVNIVESESSTLSAFGTNVNATKQAGEPNHAGKPGGRSIWFRWTAPDESPVSIDTFGSTFDTLLAVYRGTAVNALARVASNDNSGGQQSSVTFTPKAGTPYFIAVDGANGSAGAVTVHVNTLGQSNDAFAAAQALTGASVSVEGVTVGATKQSGEPNHAGNSGGASIWYAWTSPTSGRVSIDTIGSRFDTLLGVYTGSAVDALTEVVSDDDAGGNLTSKVTFTAAAGTTYLIAVDGFGGAVGDVELRLSAANPTPANDDFASAAVLTGGSTSTTGTNVNATKQSGEPLHAGNAGGHSVWYRWTAPATSPYACGTVGSTFDTLLAVYSGNTVDALTLVSSDDDSGGNQTSRLVFNAVAGTTYSLAVDGYAGAVGTIALQVAPAVIRPANDDFANAVALTGTTATLAGTSGNATKESGEPNHAGNVGGASVWYAWTAPTSGPFSLNTIGSSFDTVLAVYTGAVVAALTPVASDDDSGGAGTSRLSWNAVAGTTYRIAVDGFGGAAGTVVLNLAPIVPSNDALVNAVVLDGTSVAVQTSSVNATKEVGEPNHSGNPGGASVWYSWRALSTGIVNIDTVGSSFDTVLAVYTGDSVSVLTRVTSDDDSGGSLSSKVTFTATAGTTYFVAVDGFNGASGDVALHLAVAAPANNGFADAVALTGIRDSKSGSNVGGTKEAGEPNHAGTTGGASVWYTWTAPSAGPFSLDTLGSSFDTVLAVYTGNSVASLTSVASNDDGVAAGFSSRLTFSAVAGTTYRIAVDGFGGATGTVVLNLAPVAPANDAFANAVALAGNRLSETGSNFNATMELGEPNHAGRPVGASVWYSWMAPAAGTVTVDTIGSAFDTVLAVYTGTSVSSLQAIASDDDSGGQLSSRLTFSAVAGTTYRIAVDGFRAVTGSFVLNLARAGFAAQATP